MGKLNMDLDVEVAGLSELASSSTKTLKHVVDDVSRRRQSCGLPGRDEFKVGDEWTAHSDDLETWDGGVVRRN